MNRSNLVGAALLVVGLLLGGLIVERAGAQARVTKVRTWPPAPEDMIQLRGTSPGIDDGALVSVFTVPNDRWFILTEIRIGGYGEYDATANTYVSPVVENFSLITDARGVISVILDPQETPFLNPGVVAFGTTSDTYFRPVWNPLNTITGVAVQPGAVLKVRYKSPGDVKGDSTQAHAQWNIIGYLTDR
jgi:hypothetical protein